MPETAKSQPKHIHKVHLSRVKEISGCRSEAKFADKNEFNTGYITTLAKFSPAADGQNDDSEVIQKAVDHVLDKGGGCLIFPPGTYLVDAVKVGPGLTLWGYGARILKPGIGFYMGKYLNAISHELDSNQLTQRLEHLSALAFTIDNSEIDRATQTLTHTPEELENMTPGSFLSEEEMVEFRARVASAMNGTTPDDTLLLTLMQQVKGGRSHAKWARTFQTSSHIHVIDQYQYSGKKDSHPIVFKGFYFDGNRLQMGLYRQYELQQQHMISLRAHPYSLGRLTAYLRDLCFVEGVGDAISIHTNVRAYIRNTHSTNVFRGAVTVTGGNSRIDMADIKADGDVHPTGVDWEVDSGAYVRNGRPTAAPQFHSWVKADRLDIAGDFDLGMRGGKFIGSRIVVRDAPVNISGVDSVVRIRNSFFRAGSVQTSSRDDTLKPGRFAFTIRHPKNVSFEGTTFQALAPAEGELNGPLAFYSLMTLVMSTSYFQPRNHRLRFSQCKFVYDSNLPEETETRVLSTGNDTLLHNNGVLFESCTVDRGFDYGLHIGGGSGAYRNWGSVGGGSFRIIDSSFNSRVGVYLGSSTTYQTRADLRGLMGGSHLEQLFEKPLDANQNEYLEGVLILP